MERGRREAGTRGGRGKNKGRRRGGEREEEEGTRGGEGEMTGGENNLFKSCHPHIMVYYLLLYAYFTTVCVFFFTYIACTL